MCGLAFLGQPRGGRCRCIQRRLSDLAVCNSIGRATCCRRPDLRACLIDSHRLAHANRRAVVADGGDLTRFQQAVAEQNNLTDKMENLQTTTWILLGTGLLAGGVGTYLWFDQESSKLRGPALGFSGASSGESCPFDSVYSVHTPLLIATGCAFKHQTPSSFVIQ